MVYGCHIDVDGIKYITSVYYLKIMFSYLATSQKSNQLNWYTLLNISGIAIWFNIRIKYYNLYKIRVFQFECKKINYFFFMW